MRDNGGIEINTIDWNTVKNNGIKWSFDQYGNPIPDPKPDELFKTYKVDDEYYLDIFTIIVDQSDLEPTIAYMYDVYKINKLDSHGSVANKTVYTSPNDCLDAALFWIQENKSILDKYFSSTVTELPMGLYRIGEHVLAPDETNILDDSKTFIKYKL
jgi:hypothetical protein